MLTPEHGRFRASAATEYGVRPEAKALALESHINLERNALSINVLTWESGVYKIGLFGPTDRKLRSAELEAM